MKIVFTCLCGNKLEVDAENWFMAQKGVEKAGWKYWTSSWVCPECLEMPDDDPRRPREEGDQEVPR